MSRDGVVRFERDAEGQLVIVLLVQGVPIARSRQAANIAAEVVFRNLGALRFNDQLVVAIPTDGDTLDSTAGAWPVAAERDAAEKLIAACAW